VIAIALAGCVESPQEQVRSLERQAAHAPSPDPSATYRPCHEPDAAATPSPDVAKTESVAMPEDRFWSLIDMLHHSLKQSAFDRVSRVLSTGPMSDVVGFDARMTLDLYALDSACRVEWYGRHDPEGLGFPLDDDFLYFRCSTIIAGRQNYEVAASTQTLPWGDVSTDDDGESLLYIGITAAEMKGWSDDRFSDYEGARIPLSYETASNPQGWPASDVDKAGNIPTS
jgi:hypothetical protein